MARKRHPPKSNANLNFTCETISPRTDSMTFSISVIQFQMSAKTLPSFHLLTENLPGVFRYHPLWKGYAVLVQIFIFSKKRFLNGVIVAVPGFISISPEAKNTFNKVTVCLAAFSRAKLRRLRLLVRGWHQNPHSQCAKLYLFLLCGWSPCMCRDFGCAY